MCSTTFCVHVLLCNQGAACLPDQGVMTDWVNKNINESRQRRLYSLRGVPQADFLVYRDEIAEAIGCKPNLGI